MNKTRSARVREKLEKLYDQYHHARWLGSDPLQFVYAFEHNADREVVGLLAASLAYGNVTYINRSIRDALCRMDQNPYRCLIDSSEKELRTAAQGFRHRWTDEHALSELWIGMKGALENHGGLGNAFSKVDDPDQEIVVTLGAWVNMLRQDRPCRLLSDPSRGSACKRLHLYLRWMVRNDEVDPGCWKGISPGRLMIPLDTHMHRFAVSCGFTGRKAADARTVMEITRAFRRIQPDDPVRFDFSLTRPGIIEGWKP